MASIWRENINLVLTKREGRAKEYWSWHVEDYFYFFFFFISKDQVKCDENILRQKARKNHFLLKRYLQRLRKPK